jgi:hypothetical protein
MAFESAVEYRTTDISNPSGPEDEIEVRFRDRKLERME